MMLSRAIYREVARLHAQNIDQGFLSRLGIPFLSLLYEAIDANESSTLIVRMQDNHAVGFVAGTESMRPIYRQLIRRWPRLLWYLLPTLLSPNKLWGILEILTFGRKSPSLPATPQAELLSIAVDSAYRGNGCAQSLYCSLVDFFMSRGVDGFRIVVGESLVAAHRFYSKMGAIVVGTIQVHAGKNSIVYVHRLRPMTGNTLLSSNQS